MSLDGPTTRTPTTDPLANPTPADVTERALAGLTEIKLGRVGHYSYNDSCQTALLVKTYGDIGGSTTTVNLVAFDSDGDMRPHTSVPVRLLVEGELYPTTGTFHLNRDCPWGR